MRSLSLVVALACIVALTACPTDEPLLEADAAPSPWDSPAAFELERIAGDQLGSVDDLAFSASGRLVVLLSDGQLARSEDLGASWQRCAIPDVAGKRTIAISPDGERVFVAGQGAAWTTVDASCVPLRGGRVNHPVSGDYASFTVTSAHWHDRDAILVGLSNAGWTDGLLAQGIVPASTTQLVTWSDLAPTRIQGGNTAHPAAVQSVHRTTNGVIIAGLYRFLSSGGSSIPEIHERLGDGLAATWASVRVPDALGRVPRSIAARDTNVSPTLYIVDRDQRDVLFVSRFGIAQGTTVVQEVALTGFTGIEVTARLRVARLDPEARVWIATDRGLFRSTTALPAAH